MTTKLKKPPNPIWIFYHHFGLSLRNRGDEFVTTCPWCGKEDHLSITQKEGLYNCLVCSKHGNTWTFLNEFHTSSLQQTSDGHYQALADNRRLLPATLRMAGIAKSILSDCWLIPSRNQLGKLTNLYQAIPQLHQDQPHAEELRQSGSHQQNGGTAIRKPPRPASGGNPIRKPPRPNGAINYHPTGRLNPCKFEIRSSPEPCSQQLYGIELIKHQKTLIICEGHWDRLALWEIFAHLSLSTSIKSDDDVFTLPWEQVSPGHQDYNNPLLQNVGIVAVPGANIFKADWAKLCRNRRVILIYDNDPDRVVCPKCRGTEGYKPHLLGTNCPKCGGKNKPTNEVINPGKSGIEKVVKELGELGITPHPFQKVQWKSRDPKDIRDLLI